MSSEWIVAIITSMFAVAAAALTCRWQMKTEMRKILENYVSDKKYKAYYNAVNLFYSIMNENKQGKNVDPTSPERYEIMLKVKRDLFIYGSDDAFRTFTTFLCESSKDHQADYFTPFLNFMLIVRKEISGGKSAISTDDIMLNLLQSRSELQKFHDAFESIFRDSSVKRLQKYAKNRKMRTVSHVPRVYSCFVRAGGARLIAGRDGAGRSRAANVFSCGLRTIGQRSVVRERMRRCLSE